MNSLVNKIDNITKIARTLHEENPDEDVSELSLENVKELIESMDGFDEDEFELTPEMLQEIHETWIEIHEQDDEDME